MRHATAKKQGLEPIFAEDSELGQRMFYDSKEGKYYDATTDLYYYDGFDPRKLIRVFNRADEPTYWEKKGAEDEKNI